MEFWLFLPQMRLSFEQLADRARAAEAAGFHGIALMDHLEPPLARGKPMYEAMATAMWLAANTSTLRIGHLVLCDVFREPAVLAQQVVALDHASNGRFELGIGSGSVPQELPIYGVTPTTAGDRVTRLGETLEVLQLLWSGEVVSYDGQFHTLRDAQQVPTPLGKVPIVIGAMGPRMLQLVADHAEWWNLPVHQVSRIDELRPSVGNARVSIQQMVTYLGDASTREETLATANARFGATMALGSAVGDGSELIEHFHGLAGNGVERVYTWFTDFAADDTLAGFGRDVIAEMA